MPLTRYKLTIEYDGTGYAGFQIQDDIKTVAGVVTNAIYNVSRESITLTCAGRTDSGVHAEGQIVHFDLNKNLEPYQIIEAINSHLKNEQVSIVNCEIVDERFDARRSSKGKIYRYQILNRKTSSPLMHNRVWYMKTDLNIQAIQKAAKFFEGVHDFESFRTSGCQAKHAIRKIDYIQISKANDLITIHVKGNAFVHNMVRIITGTLIEVGLGKIAADSIPDIFKARDRTKAGRTAPAAGLFLEQVLF